MRVFLRAVFVPSCAFIGAAAALHAQGPAPTPIITSINPSNVAAGGPGFTLTVHLLGVAKLLRRRMASTNRIESCVSTVERVARHVKRWHGGDQSLRWTATGLLEAERKFRKVKDFRELAPLHRQLNPQCACEACQQWRLTQQAQVA